VSLKLEMEVSHERAEYTKPQRHKESPQVTQRKPSAIFADTLRPLRLIKPLAEVQSRGFRYQLHPYDLSAASCCGRLFASCCEAALGRWFSASFFQEARH